MVKKYDVNKNSKEYEKDYEKTMAPLSQKERDEFSDAVVTSGSGESDSLFPTSKEQKEKSEKVLNKRHFEWR